MTNCQQPTRSYEEIWADSNSYTFLEAEVRLMGQAGDLIYPSQFFAVPPSASAEGLEGSSCKKHKSYGGGDTPQLLPQESAGTEMIKLHLQQQTARI
ncbi:uncharacterized protein LOC144303948 isoform X9 [Canis aureus]